MRTALVFGLALASLTLATDPAAATFGCTVVGSDDGFAALYEDHDERSKAIRKVPDGDMVSVIDYPTKPAPDGWTAVKHDENGSNHWGAGTFGWMLSRQLEDCG